MTSPTTIPLYLASQKAYIWDPQHAATLRVTHHIGPLATGTLPGVAQQNVFLGLPLVLMPEEAVLLVENGICHFVHVPSAFRPPTPAEIEQHTSTRLQTVHELQLAAFEAGEEKKRAFANSLASGAAAGKGKRGKKGKEDGQRTAVTTTETTTTATEMEPTSDSLFTPTPPPPRQTPPATSQAYFSSITSHPVTPTHPWFDPSLSSNATYTSLSHAQEAGVWNYPSTKLESARCAVYRRLWEKGMFMGQGVKFGGEFLVYPGDPLRYHSHFVTTTLPSRKTAIRPLELVAWGRLGTATKKAHLLCCVDLEADVEAGAGAEVETAATEEDHKREGGEEKKNPMHRLQVKDTGSAGSNPPLVQFYSLEWANFG